MSGQMKKRQQNAVRELLKDDLLGRVLSSTGETGVLEYRFAAPERRWRADFAWPRLRVALEIDGGTWVSGRHNRPGSVLKDMEKGNGYAVRGWLALHTPWAWVEDGSILPHLIRTIRLRQDELRIGGL